MSTHFKVSNSFYAFVIGWPSIILVNTRLANWNDTKVLICVNGCARFHLLPPFNWLYCHFNWFCRKFTKWKVKRYFVNNVEVKEWLSENIKPHYSLHVHSKHLCPQKVVGESPTVRNNMQNKCAFPFFVLFSFHEDWTIFSFSCSFTAE